MQGEQSSPRSSLTHRGSIGGSTKSLVGPIAERQTGEGDRALLPRRSGEPDVNLLGAEAGMMGTVIDTSDMRSSCCGPHATILSRTASWKASLARMPVSALVGKFCCYCRHLMYNDATRANFKRRQMLNEPGVWPHCQQQA